MTQTQEWVLLPQVRDHHSYTYLWLVLSDSIIQRISIEKYMCHTFFQSCNTFDKILYELKWFFWQLQDDGVAHLG